MTGGGGKGRQPLLAVTGDILLKAWNAEPSQTETCQDMPFWDAVKWFRLRILHSILLKLFAVGRRPLDYFHVVGVQANLPSSK